MSTWRESIMGQAAARADTCHSTGPSPVLPGMVHQGSPAGLTAAPVAPSTLLPHTVQPQPSPHQRFSGDQEQEAEGRVHAELGPRLCFHVAQRVRIFSDLGRGKQPLRACCVP